MMNGGGSTSLAGPSQFQGHHFPNTKTVMIDGAAEMITFQIDPYTGGYIRGVDTRTDKHWHADIAPNGSMRGSDLDGSKWTYSGMLHQFTNLATGRTCAKSTFVHVCPK
jgi:hypothetical protein